MTLDVKTAFLPNRPPNLFPSVLSEVELESGHVIPGTTPNCSILKHLFFRIALVNESNRGSP